MAIFPCKGCVAPKRYPGCQDHCPEYKAKRAEYDKLKAAYDRERDVSVAMILDRRDKVYKAMKDRRRMRT